jgi:acetate kinase
VVPLPARSAAGVQRYGFHGLSYEYIASALPQVAPEIAGGRVIVAHLGSGASLCAMKQGKSMDSTLGFTALDGLCMGHAPGAVDPGVVLYLFQTWALRERGGDDPLQEVRAARHLGISNDMRDSDREPRPGAVLAVDYFVYRAALEIGALARCWRIDALSSPRASARTRPRSPAHLRGSVARVDRPDGGEPAGSRISREGSRVSAWVIPTNEE